MSTSGIGVNASMSPGAAALLARTYGLRTQPASPSKATPQAIPAASVSKTTQAAQPGVIARVQSAVSPEQIRATQAAAAARPKTNALVGALVPGKVDFSGAEPRPSIAAPSAGNPAAARAAMPFYSRPTDRVEVATVLTLGRSLDVKG
ncbi:MAG: hypothetical protein MUE97_01115 [Phycisphaerales bacterium]|nr:hypothetical protein [Phycisphaerales bacterium]